jgi:hypothetical protein
MHELEGAAVRAVGRRPQRAHQQYDGDEGADRAGNLESHQKIDNGRQDKGQQNGDKYDDQDQLAEVNQRQNRGSRQHQKRS